MNTYIPTYLHTYKHICGEKEKKETSWSNRRSYQGGREQGSDGRGDSEQGGSGREQRGEGRDTHIYISTLTRLMLVRIEAQHFGNTKIVSVAGGIMSTLWQL